MNLISLSLSLDVGIFHDLRPRADTVLTNRIFNRYRCIAYARLAHVKRDRHTSNGKKKPGRTVRPASRIIGQVKSLIYDTRIRIRPQIHKHVRITSHRRERRPRSMTDVFYDLCLTAAPFVFPFGMQGSALPLPRADNVDRVKEGHERKFRGLAEHSARYRRAKGLISTVSCLLYCHVSLSLVGCKEEVCSRARKETEKLLSAPRA